MIIVSLNSGDMEDVRSRKVFIHDTTSKSKGQDILSELRCLLLCARPHCTQSRTAHDIHDNREQRFLTQPHFAMAKVYGTRTVNRGDKRIIRIYLWHTANYLNCFAPKVSTAN